MATLPLAAIASQDSILYLGGPTSPPTYVALGRLGDIKFPGLGVDIVDVSNQNSQFHRTLATLAKIGTVTGVLYWEPASTQDQSLFSIIYTAPPVLQQWKMIWPDGTSYAFNAWLSKAALDATIAKALMANIELTVDNGIAVVYGAGPT
jgi:tail tube protein